MHPDPESTLQQASPVPPRCPITPCAPGLRLCDSFERKTVELPSHALRSSSVGAYGGGASIVGGGGEVGGVSFVMFAGVGQTEMQIVKSVYLAEVLIEEVHNPIANVSIL